MSFESLISAEFAPHRVLSDVQLRALSAHHELVLKWNKRLNLWRVADLTEAVQLHYCEGLFLGLQLPREELKIIDVGSGAGFPGFPIAILRPECLVTLLESDKRKAAFLREAAHGVTNLRVLATRAEQCDERYDWMVSRAVRPDLIRNLSLAPNGALLTSQQTAIKVPWGRQRFIEMFHVEL